jgi:hypothetical protein
MGDNLEISPEVLSLTSLEGLSGIADPSISTKLARMRDQQKKGRVDLEQHAKDLSFLYDRAVKEEGATPEYLMTVVDILRARRNNAAEFLIPGIDRLRQNLVSRPDVMNSDLRETFEESLFIAQRWLELFDEACSKLLKLAEQRARDEAKLVGSVHREVDWAELSREHIARYPKIRARLAE